MYSIREKFREGLYDSKRKPRLNYAQNYFLEFSLDKDLNFRELERFYNEWRDFIEYIVLQKQSDSLKVKGEVERETFAVSLRKIDKQLIIKSVLKMRRRKGNSR